MSKTCIDLHTPYLKSKFNKLIKSGVKEKDAELEIAIEEAKRIFNSLNSLKTKLGIKLSEEDEITNAIVTAKAEDFQDLSETFDLEGELKTKIDALEKIIKDAESEDAPATVKQKLIEKGNAKLAEMKAELAAMQQSKNETSSIEDKKADIERRREEELKDYNTINFEELKNSEFKYRLKDSKGIVLHKSEIRYSSYNNQLEFVNTKDIGKWLSKWYPTEDYRNTNISDPDILFRVDFSQFKEQLKKFHSGDGIKFLEEFEKLINAKYDAELAALTKQDTSETEVSGKEQLDALFGEVVTPQPTEKQETPIEKLRRLAKEKIEESKLQSTSEFNYRGGTYTIDYNRNLLSPIPKTTTAQKNLIDSIGKQDIYDVINSTINSKDVYLVFNKNLNKFVILDKNLNSIPLDESVVTSKAYQDAKNRCK